MGQLQKEGLRPNPEAPKTILGCNSAYKLRTNTTELPKLRTFKVRAPTLTRIVLFFMEHGGTYLSNFHEKNARDHMLILRKNLFHQVNYIKILNK